MSRSHLPRIGNEPSTFCLQPCGGIGELAAGATQKVGRALGIDMGSEGIPKADAVGQFFKDRYGAMENIKHTLATDPVGSLADAATVLSGGELAGARAAFTGAISGSTAGGPCRRSCRLGRGCRGARGRRGCVPVAGRDHGRRRGPDQARGHGRVSRRRAPGRPSSTTCAAPRRCPMRSAHGRREGLLGSAPSSRPRPGALLGAHAMGAAPLLSAAAAAVPGLAMASPKLVGYGAYGVGAAGSQGRSRRSPRPARPNAAAADRPDGAPARPQTLQPARRGAVKPMPALTCKRPFSAHTPMSEVGVNRCNKKVGGAPSTCSQNREKNSGSSGNRVGDFGGS